MKYDVFISYSRKDSEITDTIVDCLEDNGISCFIDREGIYGGEEYSNVISEHIEQSTVFLFIGSKNSYESKWTPKELHFAIDCKSTDAIIPYIIDEEAMPSSIRLDLSNINIRNIKEHPKERLIEDIKKALEKLNPKNAKEDVGMAKSISEQIEKSAHNLDDNLQLLMELGKINSSRRFDRLSESEVYYSKAIDLYERAKTNELSNDKQYYYIYYHLAKIKKEKEQYSDAEKLYQKYIDLMASISNISPSRKAEIIDGIIDLAEVQCFLKEYESSCNNCEKAQKMMVSYGIEWDTIDMAQRLVEIQIKALRELGKNEEADSVQDNILSLFRNQPPGDLLNTSFSDLLVAFAQFCRNNNQLDTTRKYLEEAYGRDEDNMDIVLDLAKTYDELEMKTEAYNMYMKAFSNGLKQSDSYYFRRKGGLEELLKAIVAFFDKNGYNKEIEKCFELTISKYQLDIYNGLIDQVSIGNIYEQYADWLAKRDRYSEAKKHLTNYLDLIDTKTNGDFSVITCFHIRSKIARILYCLHMSDKALEVMNDAISSSKGFSTNNPSYLRDFLETVFSAWSDFENAGFHEGSEFVKEFLVKDYNAIKLDSLAAQASYYTQFGWYMLLMEEYDTATKPLVEALRIEEKLKRHIGAVANAKNNLARLYIHTKQFDKAEKLLIEAGDCFEKLAQKDTNMIHNLAENQSYFGQLYEAKKEYAKAELYFEQSLSNYREAAKINEVFSKYVEETAIMFERVKAMQE